MSHVTYECVMSHMNESCHIWMSHVTLPWCTMRHVTYEWVMSPCHGAQSDQTPLQHPLHTGNYAAPRHPRAHSRAHHVYSAWWISGWPFREIVAPHTLMVHGAQKSVSHVFDIKNWAAHWLLRRCTVDAASYDAGQLVNILKSQLHCRDERWGAGVETYFQEI